MKKTNGGANRFAGAGKKGFCLLASALLAVSLVPAAGMAPEARADEGVAADAPQAMTQERIDEANDAYNNAATNLTFITMSDTELSGNATEGKSYQQVAYEGKNIRFQRIAQWAEEKGFDIQAVVDNGDVIGGNEAEYYAHLDGDSEKPAGWYRAVEQVMTENFPGAVMMFTQGNHDIADLMGDVFDEKHADDPNWYYPNDDTNNVGNWHAKVNGYDFIGLDYNGATTFGYGNQRNGYQDFLRQTLEEISSAEDYDPGKPIFVNIHSGYAGTSLGGPFHGDYDTAGNDLQAILADYPQVLVGSAHTHFSVEPETSIYQDNFTFYENGSISYIYQDVPSDFLGGGYFDDGQGTRDEVSMQESTCNFISILEDGSTVIRRFDVTHQRWIGMPWVIDTTQGKDGFKYTDDQRSTVAPWWEEGAAVAATDATETSVTIGFDQAVDDELVNYYDIAITDKAGNPVEFKAKQIPNWGNTSPESFSGSFKAYSRWYMDPNTMGFEITGLSAATTYTVTVKAYDDFQNESAEPLVGTFRTANPTFPEFPEGGEAQLPDGIEEGQYFDMAFEGDLDNALGDNDGTSHGNVSYVDSYSDAAGQAVYVPSGTSNYVDLGNRDEWNLGTDKDITINFWMNMDSCSGYSTILSNKNWADWWRSGINVAPENNNTQKLEFTVGDGTGSSGGIYCTADVPDYIGDWHMVTVMVDREAQLARTYFDGVLGKENSIAGVGNITSGLNMRIGVDGAGNYSAASFAMDDLEMWNRPLTNDEVASLYEAAKASTAQQDALDTAVEYANVLKEIMADEESAGRVFDAELTAALDAAIENAQTAQGDAIKEAFDALKAAAEAVESQAVLYKVTATAVDGEVVASANAVEEGSDVTFELVPAEGFQVGGSAIEVAEGYEYELNGTQLVVKGATGPVTVHVKFAKIGGGFGFPAFPEETLPEGIEEGQYFDMAFEGNLADVLGSATGASHGNVSYVESYNDAAGQAVYIASGASNYVDLGNRDEWNLGTDKDITINFWINAESCGGYSSILSNKDWTNYWRSGINVGPKSADTTILEFTLGDDVETNGVYCDGSTPNYVGAWHMMTVMVDREAQVARSYFDGHQIAEADISGVGDMTSNLNMYLGVDAGLDYSQMAFVMDDLEMWDRPLSSDEVAALYKSATAADETLAAQLEALASAVDYANNLKARMADEEAAGRVFDEALTAALDEAIEGAQGVLNGAKSSASDAIRAAYDSLKAAVDAVEAQAVRYTVAATADNGTVTPASDVADAGSDVTFELAPAEGYQVDGATVEVPEGMTYEISGTQLVVKGVNGPVNVHVVFVKVDEGGQEPGTDPDQPGIDPNQPGTGENPGEGQNPGGDTGGQGQNPGGATGDTGNQPPDGDGSSQGDPDKLAQTNDGTLQVIMGLCGVIATAAAGLVIAWRRLRRY